MNSKILQSGPKSAVYAIPKPNRPTEARSPQSISFASHVSGSRIAVKSPFGPRRARIEACRAVTAGTAESLYEVLGIGESVSSVSDIKKAYKKMARKYHPDVSPPERVDENTRRFIMVKEAYEILSNPQRRALYDRNLAAGHHVQEIEENEEWKMRWQTQLDELKRRSNDISRRERMSWGERMRSHI
ncbi:chaperone protein dnaJ 20, chloroplastic-like [Salvia divinorum]|uniref:Chaperone protein dnaJ 20, chloroplastic-like n=1 Tax=Salvia divinorum TaxID=28513 RepID=A0ABD1HN00_SALDI